MKREYLLKTSLFPVIATTLALIFSIPVFAQSATPTATSTVNPTILTPTPSVTETPTPISTTTEVVTPTPTEKVDNVSAVVSIGTQSPWNKRIPVKLSIKPAISGEKLTIRWQSKAGLVAAPTITTINAPQAGQVYTVSFSITPYATGYQRAVADIILTTKTTNIVVSKDVSLQLNNDKVVVPITPMYIFYQVIMYLSIIVTFFILIPFGLYKAYLYIKTNVFPKWLESKIQVPR